MKVLDFAPFVVCILCEGIRVITLAEREVKDPQESSKVAFWGQDWARKVCRFSVLFGCLTK